MSDIIKRLMALPNDPESALQLDAAAEIGQLRIQLESAEQVIKHARRPVGIAQLRRAVDDYDEHYTEAAI